MPRKQRKSGRTTLSGADKGHLRRIMKKVRAIKIEKLRK
jgi:hypothetical protein